MRHSIYLLSLLFLLANCGQEEKPVDKNTKFITYNSPQYSLSFPGDWVDATGQNKEVDFVVLPPPDAANDVFADNVNVIVREIGDTINLDGFLKLTEEQLKVYFPDYIMAEKKIVKKNGMDCLVLEYQATQNNLNLRYLQHAYIYNGKVYIVTFTAEQIIFKTYVETANKILDSFRIKK